MWITKIKDKDGQRNLKREEVIISMIIKATSERYTKKSKSLLIKLKIVDESLYLIEYFCQKY